jgi:hypothetical protein
LPHRRVYQAIGALFADFDGLLACQADEKVPNPAAAGDSEQPRFPFAGLPRRTSQAISSSQTTAGAGLPALQP